MKMKIALCGAGFISGYHYDCIKRVYGINTEIVGVYDILKEKAVDFAAKRKIPVLQSLDQLFEEADVICIGTPPATHADLILKAAEKGKHIICEKPLLGYAPPLNQDDFNGLKAPKGPMLETVLKTLESVEKAIKKSGSNFCYFENFVYSPAIQKEKEIIEKSDSQILRMLGEESHRGNHAVYSNQWKHACGGSLISTGSHPIGALLYLKRVEGEKRNGKAILPLSLNARIGSITKASGYEDLGFLRSDYYDVEDYAWVHIDFEDGTVGDVVTGALVLGGIYDYIEVFANNHRSRCRMNPVNIMDVYNPGEEKFQEIYLEYGLSSNTGWSAAVPDEYWILGYQREMQDALECFIENRKPLSSLELAIETTKVIYTAYLSAEKEGQKIFIQR